MTGFVDPAFKHIKTTEPNFLLWRISKNPEESYEAKPIKKAFWGIFCSKQSYIVYCATPINRPRGITVKVLTSVVYKYRYILVLCYLLC